MAEGWAKHLKEDCIDAYSSGIEAQGLNPLAVQVMAEVGVDISLYQSNILKEVIDVGFDYVVTVCANANEACPIFPSRAVLVHKGFDDPPELARACESQEAKLNCYRRVRDEIRAFVEKLPAVLK